MKPRRLRLSILGIFAMTIAASQCLAQDWKKTLQEELPLMGHRNWIVIADSAYPWQTAPGIQTIDAGEDQLTIVNQVLSAIQKAPHVQPTIYTDAELPFVSEADAPGIGKYREGLTQALKNHTAQQLPHEEIIGKLDAAGKQFHILIIKTSLTLPYTSVFIELGCGYWNAEAEQRLREAFKAPKTGN